MTGQELVIECISKSLGIRRETINSWISVLLSTKIIYLLEPYNEFSLIKRVIKTPKVYFTDTGLAAYLARLDNVENLEINRFAGAFAETFIINQIMKSYTNSGLDFPAFYYRDNNQKEIDLILISGGVLHLIEIKDGISYSKKDISAFKVLDSTNFKKSANAIICLTDRPYVLDKNTFALPISAI
jgi:predicted AAA+ superfamily ATPase